MSNDPSEPVEGNWKEIVDSPPIFGTPWDPEIDGCYCHQHASMPLVTDVGDPEEKLFELDKPVVLRELRGVHYLKYRCKLCNRKMIAQFVAHDMWLGEHRVDGKDD